MGVDRINEIIRNHNVEFLDFGCSTGGSINRFSSMIKGSPVGLGLDIDPLKVATTRSAGYLAEVCDITELADQGIKVRFVSMSHFLEHIPDPGAIARILKVACRIARDFIIIVQPNFDLDAYLFRNGKKFYWSDWSGHPNRMTNLGFHNIFYPLWEKGGINAFSIFARNRIETLDDPRIIPLASPVNQPGPKPDSTRVQPTGGDETAGWELYAETVVLIEKRPAPRREIMHKLGSMRLLYQVSRLAETH